VIKKSFVVQNSTDRFVRPAMLFVQKAATFSCEVNVIKENIRIDGKSLMAVMSMGITKGAEITLEVHGEQEAQVLKELETVWVPALHD
jgi:phosphotransferase system HPr (HPr) family protein